LDEAGETRVDDDTLERWMLAFHATAGARLIENWKLPHWMQSAIAGHHEPALAREHGDLAAMLVLGDEIAEWCAALDDAREARIRSLPVLARLGLYPEDMDDLLARRTSVADLTRDFA
jgi:HD-like signal output (HDOD) protein